jgi:hypothetical protein
LEKDNMMKMIMMSKYNHLRNLLESITSLKHRFEQFEVFECIVQFLFDATTLKSLDNDELKKS